MAHEVNTKRGISLESQTPSEYQAVAVLKLVVAVIHSILNPGPPEARLSDPVSRFHSIVDKW